MSKRTDRPKLDPSSQPAPSTVSEISSNLETLQPSSPRQKRRVSGPTSSSPIAQVAGPSSSMAASSSMPEPESSSASMQPPVKKSRTNTPWTAAEEQRLKNMREAGNSWADIAKTFPARTEGSVKKHWYKDMHYAEFAEDEVQKSLPAFEFMLTMQKSQALLNAIKEYETNKWKVIGQKVGKPAKACEQYAKEHFGNKT